MGDYFKPLRRQIGVVTLVAACLFAAGWVRSLRTVDRIDLLEIFMASCVQSKGGRIAYYEDCSPRMVIELGGVKPENLIRQEDLAEYLATHVSGPAIPIDPMSGFRKVWEVPFSTIVIPLTMLSAWLLLRKSQT